MHTVNMYMYLPVCGSVIHHNPTWSSELQYDDIDTLFLLQLVREMLLEEHE